MSRGAALALLAPAALALAACGAGTGIRDEGALASPQSGNALVPQQTIGVYFVRYGTLFRAQRRIKASDNFAQAALAKLVAGPTDAERAGGTISALPSDTRVVDVSTLPDTGDVRVDLASSSFDTDADLRDATGARARRRQMQLEQIVFTLTSFPTIRTVSVTFNGFPAGLPDLSGGPLDTSPLNQASFQPVAAPADSVDTCAVGQKLPPRPALRLSVAASSGFVSGRFLRVSGTTPAKTGTLVVELVQGGQIIRPTQLFNKATAKTTVPCQVFSGALEIPYGVDGAATVRAFVQEPDQSPPKAQVDVPVTLVTGG